MDNICHKEKRDMMGMLFHISALDIINFIFTDHS